MVRGMEGGGNGGNLGLRDRGSIPAIRGKSSHGCPDQSRAASSTPDRFNPEGPLHPSPTQEGEIQLLGGYILQMERYILLPHFEILLPGARRAYAVLRNGAGKTSVRRPAAV